MKYYLLIFLSLLSYGCATVTSSANYAKGTEALEKGDVETSIGYLEEAVRLEPQSSKNHNNLASAYTAVGRIDEAWLHVRKAVVLDPWNEYAVLNSRHIFKTIVKAKDLQEGDSELIVIEKLGKPESTKEALKSECGCTWWQYGSVGLSFVDGMLSGVANMERR